MKRIVITYGLISGAIAAGFLWTSTLLWEKGYLKFDNFDYGVLIGYASMIVSLSMVFFGIKAYRDDQEGRTISFWKAVQVGILISLVGSVIYAAGWEAYFQTNPGFMDQYAAKYMEKLKAKGAAQEEIDATTRSMASMQQMYKNPAFRFGITLFEILPVGFIVTLLSAAFLRRRQPSSAGLQT